MTKVFCKNCGSNRMSGDGVAGSGNQRYKCADCKTRSTSFYKKYSDFEANQLDAMEIKKFQKVKKSNKIFVVTSALNDCALVPQGLKVLENYCKHRNAQLLVIPVAYRNSDSFHQDVKKPMQWPTEVAKYLIKGRVDLNNYLTIGADININATKSSPINGFESISKEKSLILGHAKVQMKTVAVPKNSPPKMITTTGSISEPVYTNSTAGNLAKFHHSIAAVVVEIDGDAFWIRMLHIDKNGILCDLDKSYTDKTVSKSKVAAVVFGDTHELFLTPKMRTLEKQIIQELQPEYKVFNDVLDGYSGSHHHKNNPYHLAKKVKRKLHLVREELNSVCRYFESFKDSAQTIVVESNHHSHLLRWMCEYKPYADPANFAIYSELSHLVNKAIEDGSEIDDPFILYLQKNCKAKLKFIDSNTPFHVRGIGVENHGDRGINGARGSAKAFAGGAKTVIGHSHAPCIEEGCYQTGTSVIDLEYVKGLSSHALAHVLIYENGKRTHIFCINGKYRL